MDGYLKDIPLTVPTILSREGFHSIGVLDNRTLYCRFYDKVDTANYIESLTGICKRYGKFVLFLENAAYRKSKALKEFLEDGR